MRLLARLLFASSIGVALWIAVCTVAGIEAAEDALHPGRLSLPASAGRLAQTLATHDRAGFSETGISAPDGTVLRAWMFRPVEANGDFVILLHGHSNNRSAMLGVADLLLRHGYSVLLPDARAHGQSGGAVATYGVREASDVRAWFDWIGKTQSPRCIDGLGESMGAAQLLVSLKSVSTFCAVVAESPFASFREASYERVGQRTGTGVWSARTIFWPVIEAGFLYADLRYGVDFESASPQDAVAASHTPVLLIHGWEDRNLPRRHSETIVAESRSRKPEVVLWEPLHADHCGAYSAEPAEYERRVIGWFDSHLATRSDFARR